MQLFYTQGDKNASSNRLRRSDRYKQTEQGSWSTTVLSDPFRINDDEVDYNGTPGTSWNPWFSGTRNQSVNIDFGCHTPLPNGHAYKVPYELVLVYNKTILSGKKMTLD